MSLQWLNQEKETSNSSCQFNYQIIYPFSLSSSLIPFYLFRSYLLSVSHGLMAISIPGHELSSSICMDMHLNQINPRYCYRHLYEWTWYLDTLSLHIWTSARKIRTHNINPQAKNILNQTSTNPLPFSDYPYFQFQFQPNLFLSHIPINFFRTHRFFFKQNIMFLS